MVTLETDDWRIAAWLDWTPKKQPYSIQCPSCRGNGTVGGGFKDIDGPRQCPQCYGSRQIKHPGPDTPKPPLPPELIDHMRSAFKQFFEQHGQRIEKPMYIDEYDTIKGN